MVSFITPSEAMLLLANNSRQQRLNMRFTQSELSKRSGVALPTLRKFEQQGKISLESFLKLQIILGGLDKIIKSTEGDELFSSINDVINPTSHHNRGRSK